MFWAQWICCTRPLPVSCVVEIAKSRSPPSFSAYEVRSFIGQRGHGVTSSGRCGGGSPTSSICVTDAAPSRWALRDAVGAGVAAADHDHVLAGGADRLGRRLRSPVRQRPELAGDEAVALVQVLHREVHTAELAARHRQVAWHARAGRDDDRVELRAQLVGGEVDADVDAVAELDPLGGELLDAPLDDPLLDLEVRDAEPDEPAARLVALEHRHRMAGAVQLLRARQPGGAGADHRHRAPGAPGRRARLRSSPPPRRG